MKFLVAFSVVLAVAAARPGYLHSPVAVISPVVPISHQYHAQDTLGQYTYGYAAPLSSKTETRSLDGVTSGAYSYVDTEGKLQSVSYTADAVNGFRVAGTNIPVAPPAIKQSEPQPVQDTPEVAQAKKQHLDAVEATKIRNAAIVASDPGDESVQVGHLAQPVVLPYVPYTAAIPAVHYYQPYAYYTNVPTVYSYNYQVPYIVTPEQQKQQAPAEDEAVKNATEEHDAAHKEVKEQLAAVGVEVN